MGLCRINKGHDDYGKSIVEMLEKKKMTNTELCVKAGISQQTLHRIVRGIGMPSSKTTRRIAKVFPELSKFVIEEE